MVKGNVLVANTGQDSLLEKLETLIGESYQIASVSTSKEAIELMREKRFDLLITASKSPGSAGMVLAEIAEKPADLSQRLSSKKVEKKECL